MDSTPSKYCIFFPQMSHHVVVIKKIWQMLSYGRKYLLFTDTTELTFKKTFSLNHCFLSDRSGNSKPFGEILSMSIKIVWTVLP